MHYVMPNPHTHQYMQNLNVAVVSDTCGGVIDTKVQSLMKQAWKTVKNSYWLAIAVKWYLRDLVKFEKWIWMETVIEKSQFEV